MCEVTDEKNFPKAKIRNITGLLSMSLWPQQRVGRAGLTSDLDYLSVAGFDAVFVANVFHHNAFLDRAATSAMRRPSFILRARILFV